MILDEVQMLVLSPYGNKSLHVLPVHLWASSLGVSASQRGQVNWLLKIIHSQARK